MCTLPLPLLKRKPETAGKGNGISLHLQGEAPWLAWDKTEVQEMTQDQTLDKGPLRSHFSDLKWINSSNKENLRNNSILAVAKSSWVSFSVRATGSHLKSLIFSSWFSWATSSGCKPCWVLDQVGNKSLQWFMQHVSLQLFKLSLLGFKESNSVCVKVSGKGCFLQNCLKYWH